MKALCSGRTRLICLALWLGAAAQAATPSGDAMERDRIRAERAAAEAAYVRQEQLCSQKFVVTPCVNAARAQRREALTRLDRQQQVLDEAQRAQRASERLKAIESKESGEEARRREEVARERSASRHDTEVLKPATASASAAPPHAARAASSGAERTEQEARARREYELKQSQAEAHRQEVARRNEERARKGNPGAPLPTPAASAASATPPKTDVPAH
jgi:colicin import membrane protein